MKTRIELHENELKKSKGNKIGNNSRQANNTNIPTNDKNAIVVMLKNPKATRNIFKNEPKKSVENTIRKIGINRVNRVIDANNDIIQLIR